jgi:hypothetical protein
MLAWSAVKINFRRKMTKEPAPAGRHPSAVDIFLKGIVPIVRAEKRRGATATSISERFFRTLGKVYGADAIGSIEPAIMLPKFARRRRRLFRRQLSGKFAKEFDAALGGK